MVFSGPRPMDQSRWFTMVSNQWELSSTKRMLSREASDMQWGPISALQFGCLKIEGVDVQVKAMQRQSDMQTNVFLLMEKSLCLYPACPIVHVAHVWT